MTKGLFIAGTDTEVGKTYITCQILRQLRQAGINAVGMKPVASGLQQVEGQWQNEDIEEIWRASDSVVDREALNQYVYRPFIAPHLAAAQAGETISTQAIKAAYERLAACSQRVIVEGAGGLMTPLNQTETFIDLIQQLDLKVVLVVAVRLGCINHALLSQQALLTAKIEFTGWVANYPDAGLGRDVSLENCLAEGLSAPLLGVVNWCQPNERPQSLNLS